MSNITQNFPLKQLFVPLTTTKAVSIIFIVGFIVFFNALFNNFVWDDNAYIIKDIQTHQINFVYSFSPNYFNQVGQYRPFVAFYYSVLYTLFSTTPFPYHLLQILFHISCAALIFVFFRKFVSSGIALFSALVFLLHPLNVESVSYIAQTVSPLLLLFGIIPLMYLTRKKISVKVFFLSLFLLLLSLLTKETGVVFLFLAIIYSCLFTKRNIAKIISLSSIVLLLYLFLRFVIGQIGLAKRLLTPIADLTFVERLLNMPLILFYYVKNFFFPSALAVDQQWVISSVNFSTFYFPLLSDMLFLVILVTFGIYIFKQHKEYYKAYVFFFSWFLAGVFFLLQIYPADVTVADRWFYIPIVGLIGMLAIIFQSWSHKFQKYEITITIVAVIVLGLLAIRTTIRNTNWHDEITLFSHDVAISDNYSIENSLGAAYFNQGEYSRALPYFIKSASQRPYETNLQNVASTYLEMRDIQNAAKYYDMALNAKNYQLYAPHQHDSLTYLDYAQILVFHNSPNKANKLLEEAVNDYPGIPILWELLAFTKVDMHDKQGALEAASNALQLDPTSSLQTFYNDCLDNKPFTIKAQLDTGLVNKTVTCR